MNKKIIHCDMDAFFASVEQLDSPELRGKPVIVGGSRNRGVVCACSYETRPYGVHSSMPMAQALRLCPAAVALPVRMQRYQTVSRQVFAIFSAYTDMVEPLSIDEAFLDVSGCQRLFGSAAEIAAKIRTQVLTELGLVVSAGVAPNKFLAKLASDEAKPDGLLEILPEGVDQFLLPLKIEKLWGIGKVSAEKLHQLGMKTVADVRCWPKDELIRQLGRQGARLYDLARGRDDRPLELIAESKSLGAEETFPRDLVDLEELERMLLMLADRISRRARRQKVMARGLTLKVKYADFTTVTRSDLFTAARNDSDSVSQQGVALLQKTEAGFRPVRLLGLYLTGLEAQEGGQQELFADAGRERQASLDDARDQLCERFGSQGLKRASLLDRERLTKLGEQGSDADE
jgi:DNA polymerase-4